MQTATAIDALLGDVRTDLPNVRLLTEVIDREAYRLDETAYLEAGLPGAVALPADTSEVAGLLRSRPGTACPSSRAARARASPAARPGSRARSRSR